MLKIDGQKLNQTMLKVIKRIALNKRQYMRTSLILERTIQELEISAQDVETQQVFLTVLYDMFRKGILAWGHDFDTYPNPPYCHLTEQGRRTLEHLSRHPANPDGYLALLSLSNINEISMSYVKEALKAYNTDCYKAATVMIGVASEALALELRDAIVENLGAKLKPQNRKKLDDWGIKTVLYEIRGILDSEKANMSVKLKERYEANWAAFVHKIRMSRNEAGHPASIEAATNETAESALLIFPELAKLIEDIKIWIIEQE